MVSRYFEVGGSVERKPADVTRPEMNKYEAELRKSKTAYLPRHRKAWRVSWKRHAFWESVGNSEVQDLAWDFRAEAWLCPVRSNMWKAKRAKAAGIVIKSWRSRVAVPFDIYGWD